MTEILNNIHVALPEIVLLITACIALIGELFFRQRVAAIALYCSLMGLVLAGICSYLLYNQYQIVIFHGLFISDDIAQLMKIFISISVFLCFWYSQRYIEERNMPSGDYYILGLFSTLGMMVLVSAHSMLTVYLGLELLSLPLYAMTAIRRSNSDASEAAMKYFVMGAIASGMLLYGISLVFGATGELDLAAVAKAISTNWQEQSGLLSFALVFIVAGVGFKLAAAPFHMWAPDVYQGAPTSVTLFISAAPKIAAVGMAIRLLTLGLADLAAQWQHLLLIMTLLSTGLGNLLAIAQSNLKRLFAYSAISHMGYALFGILAASAAGYAAALYYVLIYSLMSVAAFGLIVLMSRSGLEVDQISDLKGLNKRNPWLAFLMMIILFSMAGVPPTVGFFTKLLVLKALVDVQLTWVAVLGLAFAVIGAFYYLRLVKVMYFEEAEEHSEIQITGLTKVLFSLNCLSLLYFGIFPGALVAACLNAFS
ncbi:NADH-quinone oxidoreductase subunit NuoN [Legionella yabuuchiae]|uniref:NADH-quinone oxidoreductase subunit NuoN n=1 Tax=Legionella yabuuchiae TaxID=376727 RepID=UPI001054DA82|nr:NADH-quinone oxidoreductase subunit NuoN [Legionella yabuuchiae]